MGGETAVAARLFALRDEKYRDFQIRLMPGVPPDSVIGVRTPQLREFAARFSHTPEAADFLAALPHRYYEENNLHAFLIERIAGFDACAAALDAFLPYVDNWATCDMMSPKALAKEPEKLLQKVREWIASGRTFTVRFGLETLMRHFLDARFSPEYLALAAGADCGEYYVQMMVAWLFATALAKQYDAALPYFCGGRLDPATRAAAIKKALESRRITAEQKALLREIKESA